MTWVVRAPAAAALAALVLAGCNGSIGGSDGTGPGGGPSTGGPAQPGGGPSGPGSPGPGPIGPGPGTGSGPNTGPTSSCSTIDPGPSPLRRLTRIEYDNTVQMLLGTSSRPAESRIRSETARRGC